MEKGFVTLFSEEELENIIMKCLHRFENEKALNALTDETFSINQVAKRLGRAHDTIKNLVRDGILKTTSDQRRILAPSLNEYMMNYPQK